MIKEVLREFEETNYAGETEKKQDVLVMEVSHNTPNYTLRVRKETHTLHNGYNMTEFMPFADGNFSYRVTQGRKSEKKLNILDSILNSNKETFVNLWKNGQYKTLVETYALEVAKQL